MGCGGSSQAPLPLDVVVTYPQKDTVAAVVKPQQNSCKPTRDATESQQIDQESLHFYLKQEKRIQFLERRKTLQSYQVKVDLLQQLEVAATNLENDRQRLSQMLKAVTDLFGEDELMTIKDELLKQRELDGLLPEQEEYLDNMNRLEVCQNELKATQAQIEVLQKEIKVLSKECEELAQLYQDRDNLLGTLHIFQLDKSSQQTRSNDLMSLQLRLTALRPLTTTWNEVILRVATATRYNEAMERRSRDAHSTLDLEIASQVIFRVVARAQTPSSSPLRSFTRILRVVVRPQTPSSSPSPLLFPGSFVSSFGYKTPTPSLLPCSPPLPSFPMSFVSSSGYKDTNPLLLPSRPSFPRILRVVVRVQNPPLLLPLPSPLPTGRVFTPICYTGDSGVESDGDDTFKDGQPAQLFRAERCRSRESLSTPDTNSTAGPTPVPTADLAPMPPTEKIFGKVAELRHQHHQQMRALKKVQELRQARLSKALQRKIEARRHRKSVTPQVREP
ncbi:unnamed protein product [Ixodes hexagonus]